MGYHRGPDLSRLDDQFPNGLSYPATMVNENRRLQMGTYGYILCDYAQPSTIKTREGAFRWCYFRAAAFASDTDHDWRPGGLWQALADARGRAIDLAPLALRCADYSSHEAWYHIMHPQQT